MEGPVLKEAKDSIRCGRILTVYALF